jgi:hypothetical protein
MFCEKNFFIKLDLMQVFVVEFETFSVGENLLTVRTEYSGSSRSITCSILLFLVKGRDSSTRRIFFMKVKKFNSTYFSVCARMIINCLKATTGTYAFNFTTEQPKI